MNCPESKVYVFVFFELPTFSTKSTYLFVLIVTTPVTAIFPIRVCNIATYSYIKVCYATRIGTYLLIPIHLDDIFRFMRVNNIYLPTEHLYRYISKMKAV